MSRSTVHLATGVPSRPSRCHILRTPLIPRPSLRLQKTRSISAIGTSLHNARAEAGRFLKASYPDGAIFTPRSVSTRQIGSTPNQSR